MAAKTSNGTGRRNFYSISYGKLSTRVKELPEGLEKIGDEDLKSSTQKVENIDLRNKYLEKTGDFPYVVFYDTIEGSIMSVNRNEFDQGVSLQLEILDSDDEVSTVQIRFYSKYTENILNRLSGLKDTSAKILFTPYAIPTEFEAPDKKIVKLYNQGVSLKVGGEKIEVNYKSDNERLPKTVQLKNAQGKNETSRVDRIDFLFEEVSKKFSNIEKPAPKESKAPKEEEVNEEDLPF